MEREEGSGTFSQVAQQQNEVGIRAVEVLERVAGEGRSSRALQ